MFAATPKKRDSLHLCKKVRKNTAFKLYMKGVAEMKNCCDSKFKRRVPLAALLDEKTTAEIVEEVQSFF